MNTTHPIAPRPYSTWSKQVNTETQSARDLVALRQLLEMLRAMSNAAVHNGHRRATRRRRVDLASLLAHLGEVDERRMFVALALPSIHMYATDVLGFTRGETNRCVAAPAPLGRSRSSWS